jgi:membrane dipeptidase
MRGLDAERAGGDAYDMNDMAPLDPRALHRDLLTLDSHIDIPWPTGPDPFTDGERRVDIPKMLRGGLAAGVFVAYLPQGKRTAEDETRSFEHALAMLATIRGMARSDEGLSVRLASTAAEVEAAKRDGALAVIPAVENGYAIGTDLSRLGKLRALGACYLTITHNGHNALADSAIPRGDLGDQAEEHGGLSPFGREAVAELNALGMLIDVSHAAKSTMLQAAELSRTPIVATHSCMRTLCNHPRNLDDDQLDALGAAGGVVQVTAVPAFIRPQGKAEEVTLADFVDHIDYAVRRIGIAHVGIGSDFDGGGGFVGWRDAGESANVTAELLRRGYDREAIAALWGGNFLRLMRLAEARAR